MARRGRTPADHLPRAVGKAGERLAPPAQRRSTADGRTTVHFKQSNFTKGLAPLKACQRRVDYINRPGAVEVVLDWKRELAVEVDTGPRAYLRPVSPGHECVTSFGTIGPSRQQQREFWAQVMEMETREAAHVQIGIIAELPWEVTPAGRAKILRGFCEEVFEKRRLPYWAAAHRPDVKSDGRNFHAHIIFYPRPGSWSEERGWDFRMSRANGEGPCRKGEFPWGTKERPGDRIRRLRDRISDTADEKMRAEYETHLAEASAFQELACRRAAVSRGGVVPKGASGYPWGEDRPVRRRARLLEQLLDCHDERRRARYARDLEQVDAYLRDGPGRRAVGPDSRSWFRLLRETWCEHCNAALSAEGHRKRYVPGSYRSLGISARPTVHLGSRQTALEARGTLTIAARANDQVTHDNLVADGLDPAEIKRQAEQAWARIRTRWARAEHARALTERRPDRALVWAAAIQQSELLATGRPLDLPDHQRPIIVFSLPTGVPAIPTAPGPQSVEPGPGPGRQDVQPLGQQPVAGKGVDPLTVASGLVEPRPAPQYVGALIELRLAGSRVEAVLARIPAVTRGRDYEAEQQVQGALEAWEGAAKALGQAAHEAGGVDAATWHQSRVERERMVKAARASAGYTRNAAAQVRILAALPVEDPSFLPPDDAFWSTIRHSHAAYRVRQAPLMEAARRAAAEAIYRSAQSEAPRPTR